MTSYLRKYVTALASAKDYIAQWSSDHVFADEELIVPFPTLAIYDPNKRIWTVHIKAWVYLPLQTKSLTSYLPSLPSFLTSSKSNEKQNEETKTNEEKMEDCINVNDENKRTITVSNEENEKKITEESESTTDDKVDQDKKDVAAVASKENDQTKNKDGSSDEANDFADDLYEEALQEEFGTPDENPGRLGLFFVGSSVKIVTKSIINGVEHLLQPADESGFIEENLELSDEEIQSLSTTTHSDSQDRKFEYQIQIDQSKKTDKRQKKDDNNKTFQCTIYVLSPDGFSVISDIDDTIKVSDVLSKRLLLKHTFYSYFKPIEGISDLYQKWHEQKCQFHYVSASPWQLYPALRCFLAKYNFPIGTMNLRKFTWDLKFFKPADTYKIETISEIIDAYPLRKYICVGDSGELDPEIYSKLYIKYPQSIVHIFIRDICRTPVCLLTCEERYKKAFENIPKERWTIFKHAKEIETDINKFLSV
ncbi:unnamed protein product [Rotaria sp. Silwood2]|nr:unnamed protein product [Rotaria sp. Silwood2]CAF2629981.1 unnamed protein product [Rotaria sp. Silwood2]CAF2922386.1 unnamed protein product [Rotaria sp. Silwood2]CAF3870114.1 unnamed protein product [Rotaria sp. Silwood2]CAF3928687.1 unnamed protein product [Rotaria sp. Silwood2]